MIGKKSTFTLVELLVVIAIISILASMLMPALENALNSSRSVACMNNLKQLGASATMYASDNDSYLPPRAPYYKTGYWNKEWTIGPLSDYFASKDVLICPVVGAFGRGGFSGMMSTNGFGSNPPCDYGMNWLNGGSTSEYVCTPMPITLITKPTQAGFFVDASDYCWYWNPYGNPFNESGSTNGLEPHWGSTDWRHNSGLNAQFVDGHVKWCFTEDDFGESISYFWTWAWTH